MPFEIKVNKNNLDFLYVEHLTISKQLFDHYICDVKFAINASNIKPAQIFDWAGKNIAIYWYNSPFENEKNVFFTGFIESLDLEIQPHSVYCNILAFSYTKKIDIEPQNRFFQDPTKTYLDIIKSLNIDKFVIFEPQLERELNIPTNSLTLEYNITHWQFLLKIFKKANKNFLIFDSDNTINKSKIYYKIRNKKINENLISKMSKNTTFGSIEFTSTEIYEIGDRIQIAGVNFVVYKLKYFFNRDNLYGKYFLIDENNLNMLNPYEDNFKGFNVKAKVVDNQDSEQKGRIKIELINEQGFKIDDIYKGTYYFNFITNYTSNDNGKNVGFFSIPEIGEIVNLYFPTNDENDAYINYVFREKSSDLLSDPSHKIWRNSCGREFRITDNNIIVSAKDETISLTLDDNQIILKKGNNSYIKIEDNKVEVKNNDCFIIIDNGNINIKGNSIKIDGNDITLNASNILLKASGSNIDMSSSVNIKGSSITLN